MCVWLTSYLKRFLCGRQTQRQYQTHEVCSKRFWRLKLLIVWTCWHLWLLEFYSSMRRRIKANINIFLTWRGLRGCDSGQQSVSLTLCFESSTLSIELSLLNLSNASNQEWLSSRNLARGTSGGDKGVKRLIQSLLTEWSGGPHHFKPMYKQINQHCYR